MAALSVVGLEPWCKGFGALAVVGEHAPVGPFGLQGAVIALDLAVLPRAMRADEDLLGPQVDDGGGEIVGAAVTEMVVGDDALDGWDAGGRESPFSWGRISE